jgi:hypothetical protein
MMQSRRERHPGLGDQQELAAIEGVGHDAADQ